MRARRFIQADVFTSIPTKGNGLAVVVEAEDISDEQMLAFAAWTNLAETTFLLPPTVQGADYRLRIFTPSREMLFAGHPTLGSCAAWLHCGGKPRSPDKIFQECAIGLVEIDMTGEVPAFVAPDTKISAMDDAYRADLCQQLLLDPEKVVRSAVLENGPVWNVLELATAEDVLAVDATRVSWPDYIGVSLIGPHDAGAECDFEVRNISPSSGMVEDPITGSLNAALARWMWKEGRLIKSLLIAQGTKMGRVGRVFVGAPSLGSDRVTIGGHAHVVIDGEVFL
ncbi:PhzF family phenazine biosynthesis protein [Marivita sp. XM-24bin2]|jgi:PhzF family phenazine biosynthesis protein|uniref:PhzF family phenazine biosynthesis protein n=1 Tax=unclassified Marivita TaxID=2632480 RepID=UPI000D798263|nr:PhzF family phenazine biosynthesis protein [Marivita sp. XM-24bin2]MCR9109047.1 PhzF family phenazine biosynthesis protein [Paracoccaceae bacterium]PWL36964.1 MAG: PhzF family phenazine biosynthesis protein [Marivita sp. XM-24bin2]